MPTSTTDREARIPLAEETLSVGKRVIETGKVRVRILVDDTSQVFQEPLDTTSVEVERVPINRNVEFIPETRVEGDVTIIPIVEEVLLVRRQLVLVEEVRVRRAITTELVEQTIPARRMRAVVERAGAATRSDPEGE